MTVPDLDLPPRPQEEPTWRAQPPPAPTPLKGGWGPGRLLRRVIGVKEDVLDWVPEDRPKLARTGLIVICTALFAGLSAWIILHEFLQASTTAALIGAAFWALVIGAFDSWLISSSHGIVDRTRFWILLPRLAIAGVLGLIISEPLTLKVFESAIIQQITTDNQAKIQDLEKLYGQCYPVPTPGVNCANVKLNVAPPPDPQDLADATAERDAFSKRLDPLTKRRAYLARKVTEECGGIEGSQVSGIAGNGPLCRIRTRELSDFDERHDLAAQNTALAALDTKVNALLGDAKTGADTYKADVKAAIDAKLAEERTKLAQPPGLLERFEGLASLTERSWTVWWAHLMLAALLILIDCFPVLTKLISKPSAYDRRLADQIESKERRHANNLRLTERLHTGQNDVRLHWEEARVRREMETSDHEGRLEAAKREVELRRQIDLLVEEAKRARRQ